MDQGYDRQVKAGSLALEPQGVRETQESVLPTACPVSLRKSNPFHLHHIDLVIRDTRQQMQHFA